MLLPLSVMAMTPVSDSALSDVTGQAGVNINADLTMNISIGTMAWGDSDGIQGFNGTAVVSPWATVADGGYVGISNLNITNLRIKARETDSFNGYSSSAHLKPITIDVATGTKLGTAGTTFVRFGLGSLEISMDSMSLTVGLSDRTTPGVLEQIMGTVNIGPMAVYINPDSYVDIYAHSGCGVNIEMDVIIDEFELGYVSWGDTDGLPAGNPGVSGGIGYWIAAGQSAGYVGLDNLVVGGPITVAGTVAIDVVSLADETGGVYAGTNMLDLLATSACTVVHISFPTNFNVDVTGPITGEVKLDSTAALSSANAGTLGDIYLTGFGLEIVEDSWVDIWAH